MLYVAASRNKSTHNFEIVMLMCFVKVMGSKCVFINLLATILDFVPVIEHKLPKVSLGLNISVSVRFII